MSVNNPSDSGGGGGAEVAFSSPPSMSDMDMGAMGAWAEIMAEEQIQTVPPNEKKEENETQEQGTEESNSAVRKQQPEQQYFAVQVTNLPACTNEELFYHFGGDSVVRDIAFLPDRRCAARIDLFSVEGLKRAKELDGQPFRGRNLRVYEIREDRVRERPTIPHEFQNRQYTHEPPPYSRESSRYNSQSSLYSNDARSFDRGNRSFNSTNDYRSSNQYRGPPPMGGGTFPRGGKYFNAYDDYNNMGPRYAQGGQPYRGGGPYYNHQYNSGGYPPRSRGVQGRGGYSAGRGGYYGSQELQRSDSYHHDERDKPVPISRSRTESTAFEAERRRMELSRTSSRLSTSTEEVDNAAPRVVTKKPTNKDIFGEAKPVDTSERLREIEAKQERERLLEQQKYKFAQEEAEAARLAAASEHTESTPPLHHTHQYAGHHSHAAHHPTTHHQYHHAPSRQGLPPHAPYGPYQTSHNISQHSQQPHPNAGQYHSQQRYEAGGAPGSYRIMRRESADATDASPPLDPVHAKAPQPVSAVKDSEKPQEGSNENASPGVTSVGEAALPPPSPRRDSLSDRRRPNDSMSSSGAETLPRPAGKQRIVYRSKCAAAPLQKSATIGEIRDAVAPQRGRGSRGGRGGRGYHRGGAPNDRRSSFSGVEKPATISTVTSKPVASENESADLKQSVEERSDRPERKEHHGSHASLRGSRTGTLRKNRGSYRKDRTPRMSREEDASDIELRQEPLKTSEERLERADRLERTEKNEEKSSTPPTKKENTKAPAPSAAPTTTSSSSTSVQDKKKEKKKTNKKETSKGGKTLNNNKFALLIDSED